MVFAECGAGDCEPGAVCGSGEKIRLDCQNRGAQLAAVVLCQCLFSHYQRSLDCSVLQLRSGVPGAGHYRYNPVEFGNFYPHGDSDAKACSPAAGGSRCSRADTAAVG